MAGSLPVTTQCIVLTDPGTGPDRTTVTWLERRRWRWRQECDPCRVMADLCLGEIEQANRASWGLPRVDYTALLIDCVISAEIESLLSAMASHLGDMTVLNRRDESIELIQGDEPEPVPAVDIGRSDDDGMQLPENDGVAQARAASRPALRLADSEQAGALAAPVPEAASVLLDQDEATEEEPMEDEDTSLTAEEIHMLLDLDTERDF